MCLSRVVHVEEVSADGARAWGRADERRVEVSLAVLTLDGQTPSPGDWILVSTGLAVDRLTDAEAAAIAASRAELAADGD